MAQPVNKPYGYNILGFLSASFGLAIAAHNTVHLLHKLDQPIRLIDVNAGFGRSKVDSSCLHLGVKSKELFPFGVNVFHLNPIETLQVMGQFPLPDLLGRFNICVPFWELPVLPESWLELLRAMDIILAPTKFIMETVTKALPDVLCLHYPQAAYLPENITADRNSFGLPQDTTVFLTSFDIHSDITRKNPWTTINAFRLAFPEPQKQTLVLKLNVNEHSKQIFARTLKKLYSAADHPGIMVINEHLSYQQTLSLYASADVLVSLHKSEGLGLSIMESMSLKKPVIVTGWSGNMDFTTPENACLVDYQLIPVASDLYCYRDEKFREAPYWAEPDTDSAMNYMRLLDSDPALRKAMGSRAASDMEARREQFSRGQVWQEIKNLVQNRDSIAWQRNAEKRALLQKLLQDPGAL